MRGLAALGMLALLLAAGGCALAPRPPAPPSPPAASSPAPSPAPVPAGVPELAAPVPSVAPSPSAVPAKPAQPLARNWEEYRIQAAQRIVSANGSGAYLGKPVQPLLAIPVLEIHLREDGSVHDIRVLRRPSQARDTIKLAEEAIRRAGLFGPVTHLPKPWTFTEVFLFDHQRRFKPMSLDQ